MPLTQLDANAALIVIDLQKIMSLFPTVHSLPGVVERSAKLARAFREHHLPVVLVNVTAVNPGRTDVSRTFQPPSDWTEFLPELEQNVTDHLVSKQSWGAFHGTSLHEYLQKRGVTQTFIIGVATSIGVESTARSAYDCRYNVVLVTDAMTDIDPDAHRYSVEKIFPRLGEVTKTDDVLAAISARQAR